MYTCYWERRVEEGLPMEYPPRPGHNWIVTAYDRNGQPMLVTKNLTNLAARGLASRWIARHDVGSVEGREQDE